MTAASPSRTSVLAVGIERYDWGVSLDLPGAADHAVRFAQWALSKDVPVDRIRLACTWSTNAQTDHANGFQLVGAARDDLDKVMHDLMLEGGDLLLLYWCGHGVVQDGTSRALLTSNAVADVKRNIPLAEIQRLITSGYGTGFKQVAVFIDACATFLEQLNAERSLPHFTFGELTAKEVNHFVYLSTDLGQIANFDAVKREAEFSTQVIQWLSANSGPGTELPPNVDKLRHDIDAAFTEKARLGLLRQRPVSLLVRSFNGSEEALTYRSLPASASTMQHSQYRRMADAIIATRLLDQAEDRPQLTEILGGLDDLESRVIAVLKRGDGALLISLLTEFVPSGPDHALATAEIVATWRRQQRTAPVLDAFHRVTREQVLLACRLTFPPGAIAGKREFADAVEFAASVAPTSIGGPDTLHRFVALVEALTGTSAPDSWFQLDLQQVQALRQQAAAMLRAVSRAHMVIDLRSGGSPMGLSLLPSVVTAHMRHSIGTQYQWTRHEARCAAGDDGRPTLEGVQAAIQELLDQAYIEIGHGFTLGFITPRSLQDELPETWPVLQDFAAPRCIGLEHPVILHSGERLAARARTRAAWLHRAAATKDRVQVDAPEVEWIEDSEQVPPERLRRLVEFTNADVIGLKFAPGPAPADLATDPIISAVMAGAPYLVWPQQDGEDRSAVADQISQILELGPFAETAQRLHEVRRRNPDKVGVGLRLIWDDPSLLAPCANLLGARTLQPGE